MSVFTIPLDADFTAEVAAKFIKKHLAIVPRMDKLNDYYEGKQDILDRDKKSALANNKLVCNHAKYISDTAVGYFTGNPVQYSSKQDIEPLEKLLKAADSATQDIDLAQKLSIFGVAYEFIYIGRSGTPKLYSPDPRNAFVVYDDTVEQCPVAGVYYFPVKDSGTGKDKGYSVYAVTQSKVLRFMLDTSFKPVSEVVEEQNILGGVSVIEIYNNSTCSGDFEPVMSLIDAYNILQSDRVNDKQQFVEAILLIKGSILGDDNGEKTENYKAIRDNGLLELPEGASAEWLTRQFDEASVEVLRKSIEQDIHKFANVPCMSDESFGGNASGVAMRYKLLGFEQITKIKERYFREGLKERLRLLCNYCKTAENVSINSDEINITFTRALPVNEVEKAQLVSELRDIVPTDILLGQLPFIEDPKAAADEMEQKQKEQAALMSNILPPEMTADEQP